MFDWNDVRYFIAVAGAGSTLAASREMRVSQTTVARRITALERALGLTLFDRQQSGYVLTAAGEALLAKARSVAGASEAFAEAAAAQARDMHGTVRLTTLDLYAVTIIPEVLRDFRAAYPSILIEVDATDDLRDLTAGAADIALRHGTGPKEGGLVGRRIADNPWTLYCSRAYAAAHGIPRKRAELHAHPFVGGGGPHVWPHYQQWLKQHGLESAVAMHHGSATGLLSAVRSGVGLAVLPSFMADRDPDLVRCLRPSPRDDGAVWLLTHERLRHTPRVRAVFDFLTQKLTATRETG
ncbi:MAG: LysR family transcriptional regulator [Sphingobium sp.]